MFAENNRGLPAVSALGGEGMNGSTVFTALLATGGASVINLTPAHNK